MNDYGRFSSVTSMLDQLSWPTLRTCRKLSRLATNIAQVILHCTIMIMIKIKVLVKAEPVYRISTKIHIITSRVK